MRLLDLANPTSHNRNISELETKIFTVFFLTSLIDCPMHASPVSRHLVRIKLSYRMYSHDKNYLQKLMVFEFHSFFQMLCKGETADIFCYAYKIDDAPSL